MFNLKSNEVRMAIGISGPAATRVLVVDDYTPFRQFISSTLETIRNLEIVGEASDGFEAIQKAVELKPDLVLMDIGLPSINGIEAARQIRELVPEARMVFLSQESSADIVQEALSVGASAYVVKVNAGIELIPALEAVLAKQVSHHHESELQFRSGTQSAAPRGLARAR
jgi:DNA-binding NarL/FixJ family response regulator